MASGMRGRNYIQMNGWTDIWKFTPMFRPDFRASPMLSVLLLALGLSYFASSEPGRLYIIERDLKRSS